MFAVDELFDGSSGPRNLIADIPIVLGDSSAPWMLSSLLQAIHDNLWDDIQSLKCRYHSVTLFRKAKFIQFRL